LGRLRDLSQNTDRDSDRGSSSDQNHSKVLGESFQIKKIGGKEKPTPVDSSEEEAEGRGGRNRKTKVKSKANSSDYSSSSDKSQRRSQYSEESDSPVKRRKTRTDK